MTDDIDGGRNSYSCSLVKPAPRLARATWPTYGLNSDSNASANININLLSKRRYDLYVYNMLYMYRYACDEYIQPWPPRPRLQDSNRHSHHEAYGRAAGPQITRTILLLVVVG